MLYFQSVEILESSGVQKNTRESILERVADFTSDLTEEKINQLPSVFQTLKNN